MSFKLNDTASCFAKMLKRLRKAGTTPENGLVGMEATGHYWVALFDLLTSHGYEATVINSIQTDAFRGVWTVRKVKTDALDAAMIADEGQVARHHPRHRHLPHLRHRGRDRRSERLRRPSQAHGMRRHGSYEERIRRDREIRRAHVEARARGASMDSNVGRQLRQEERPLLRRLLR